MVYYGHNCEQMKDGGPCPSKDCVPATHVTLTDAATAGRWRLEAPEIRSAGGTSCWYGTGGMTFDAARRGTLAKSDNEVDFNVRYFIDRQQLRDAIRAGKPASVSTRYSVFHGTPYSNDDWFNGLHAISILNIRYNSALGREEGLVADPLADGRMMPSGRRAGKGMEWVPMSLLYRAAESSGGGVIHATFAPDMTNTIKTVVNAGADVRATKSQAAKLHAHLNDGAKVTVIGAKEGARWEIGHRAGTGWWRLSHVNGVPTTQKYGVKGVFIAGASLR